MTIRRYAVYFAPPAGDFADRAASWLGRDALSGQSRDQPDLGLPAFEMTKEPRRYGFHATIKPPFRLAEGCSASGLDAAMRRLSAGLSAIAVPDLCLRNLNGFLALVPGEESADLQAFAATVVRALDHFRAPLTGAEIARRRPESLTGRQRDLLDLYGYPYVLEQFRFHLTLTDRLDPGLLPGVTEALAAYFAPVLPRPFKIEDLCLFGEEDASGRFRLLHRYPLLA